MTDESYSFTAAKTRLDEIVTQVRKKDTSLEKSLDLLEEGVRLANVCTELIDHADWVTPPTATGGEVPVAVDTAAATEDADASEAEAESVDDSVPAIDEDERTIVSGDDSESEAAVPESDDAVGDVWSEDEAWADESDDDPSDGDGGLRE